MYQCGDQVVYGVHGICSVIAIETKTVNRKKIDYYVLEPVSQQGTRFYIPTQNEAAVAKLRPIITQQELKCVLTKAQSGEDVWIPDENRRKQRYRELIAGGDQAALVQMVHALYQHRDEQLASGRKFHLCDENFLRDAKKLLDSEFSLVLDMPAEEVADYVKSAIHPE